MPSKSKPAAKKPQTKSKSTKATAERETLFGFSVVSVIKWMGAQGWTKEQATNAVAKLVTRPISPATIQARLSNGRTAKGVIAAVTPAQAKQLKAAAK